ncbi:MAG: hypothetical protein OEV64_14585, partial [Desulfobulbaceae bacterium]|nr:hypothetical protein [Desulfobulbaceae bacterium]
TIGFRDADHPSSSISPSDCLPLTSPAVLSCNSGFGGINAAVLFTCNGGRRYSGFGGCGIS